MTRYVIQSISDFQKIPVNRRKTCLEEFAVWLSVADFVDKLPGSAVSLDKTEFIWTDDGKRDIYPKIKIVP